MKLISRRGFTLVELMVTVAVIGIVSFIVIGSTYRFLQEQKLRQAANEFVSYLLTARARALRDGAILPEAKACEVYLEAQSNVLPKTVIIKPTDQALNVCKDSPQLDLRTTSGSINLIVESITENSSYPITFTRQGTVASWSLSSDSTKPPTLALPRIFYFSNSASDVRRCVMIDLNSLRIGWRNSKPSANDTLCRYDGN
jgi:prepilin-type N-terminal cleavage/methylation domain-containing protein